MKKLNLKKLKEVGEKATKGHWESSKDGTSFIAHQIHEDGEVDFQLLQGWETKDDCLFACAAKNNWDQMIEALEKQDELLEEAKEIISLLSDDVDFDTQPSKWLERFRDE